MHISSTTYSPSLCRRKWVTQHGAIAGSLPDGAAVDLTPLQRRRRASYFSPCRCLACSFQDCKWQSLCTGTLNCDFEGPTLRALKHAQRLSASTAARVAACLFIHRLCCMHAVPHEQAAAAAGAAAMEPRCLRRRRPHDQRSLCGSGGNWRRSCWRVTSAWCEHSALGQPWTSGHLLCRPHTTHAELLHPAAEQGVSHR